MNFNTSEKSFNQEIKNLAAQLDLSFQVIISDMTQQNKMVSAFDCYEDLSWKIYPVEFMSADKIHATISRQGHSTRGKDIYDLTFLLPLCDKEKLILLLLNLVGA